MKRFVPSGRAELCVEDSFGEGPAIVCLHAGVCDRRMWMPQFEALATTHRVAAYDRRGFGETRYAPESFSHVDDLLAVLDSMKTEKATLMGCSMGGRLAIDFVLAHPSRVSALVLVACSVSGAPVDSNGPFEPAVQALVDRLEAAESQGDLSALNELEAQAWLDGPAQPAGRVGGPQRELFLSMNGIALASAPTGDVTQPPSAWDQLAEIEVPTLIIWGTYDFAHFGPRMRELAKRITGARAVEMEAVAHLPNLERAQEFNKSMAEFLAG